MAEATSQRFVIIEHIKKGRGSLKVSELVEVICSKSGIKQESRVPQKGKWDFRSLCLGDYTNCPPEHGVFTPLKSGDGALRSAKQECDPV